jgi:hypothetical protein
MVNCDVRNGIRVRVTTDLPMCAIVSGLREAQGIRGVQGRLVLEKYTHIGIKVCAAAIICRRIDIQRNSYTNSVKLLMRASCAHGHYVDPASQLA